jgi:hypothetical protein
LAGAGAAADPFERPGTATPAPALALVKGNSVAPARTLEQIRRELLDAHRAHGDASALEEAAEKAARHARHNTVEKLGRITQLRAELVNHVERPSAEELGCVTAR